MIVARNTLLAALVIVTALVGAGLIDETIRGPEEHKPKPAPTVVERLDGPKQAGVPQQTVVRVPEAAVKAASATHERDLHSETPENVGRADLNAAQDQQEQLAASDQLPLVSPFAAPQQRGCTTKLVRNWSSRRGVRPRILVAHYTVSRNQPGWGDVDAIVRLFDQAAFQASSNYVIDAEGHCAYIVRESDKAWTQATFNPVSVSIEFIAMGNEGGLTRAQTAKGALVFADAAKRWEIPLQTGQVKGCTVVKPGIVDHNMLGACGGGHHDIMPFSLPSFVAATLKQAGVVPVRSSKFMDAKFQLDVLTSGERAQAKTLLAERRTAERHGGWVKLDGSHLRTALAAKAWLRARNRLLHQLGIGSRKARHTVIHKLIA